MESKGISVFGIMWAKKLGHSFVMSDDPILKTISIEKPSYYKCGKCFIFYFIYLEWKYINKMSISKTHLKGSFVN